MRGEVPESRVPETESETELSLLSLLILLAGLTWLESPRAFVVSDCSWSLLNHGVAQRMRLNLGNLNPIYEREMIKLGVDQKVEGS